MKECFIPNHLVPFLSGMCSRLNEQEALVVCNKIVIPIETNNGLVLMKSLFIFIQLRQILCYTDGSIFLKRGNKR